jgi:8-oxo-dGTP pyrophosphatase MutT (NUDIX family)
MAYEIPMSAASLDEWTQRLARGRRGEVGMVIVNPAGKVLTHTKSFYPAGIFRIPTGGIGHDERVLDALRREVWEETGLEAEVQRLLAVLEHRFTGDAREVRFATYLFLLRADGREPRLQDANERIAAFRQDDIAGLRRIAEQLEGLSGGWDDWGRFRAVAHRVAAEVLGT